MRVVVTGATGNVGTSTLAALAAADEVTEIVGLARREPAASMPKTRWRELDLVSDPIEPALEGADAVVHLAWAIQPSRDAELLRAVNVHATARLLDAMAAAKVPALVYASSIGAYSPPDPDRREVPVDESHPTAGIPTSFYARHKAAVEGMLDRFEREHPDVRVARMRPALIFKGDAAAEIRRLFAGPLLPGSVVGRRLLPLLPIPAGLRLQAVHSLDVGRAFALGVVRDDARGAYNLAAEPVLRRPELEDILRARSFEVPVAPVRALTALTWRLRLQPTPPGWLDMAMAVPLMDSSRARSELGWRPQHSSREALEELLEGFARGEGAATPPLDPEAGGRFREREFGTGVGGRP